MTATLHPFGLSLADRALFNVPDAAGLNIDCQDGTVWITVDGDLRDYILEPGDHFQNSEHRRAVIYAMRPSRIRISATASPASSAQARRAAPMARGLVLESVFA